MVNEVPKVFVVVVPPEVGLWIVGPFPTRNDAEFYGHDIVLKTGKWSISLLFESMVRDSGFHIGPDHFAREFGPHPETNVVRVEFGEKREFET